MTAIMRLDGAGGTMTLAEVLDWLAPAAAHPPGADSLLALGQALSQAVLADAALAGSAEAVALAFTLRKSSAWAALERLWATVPPDCLAVPRGRCLIFAPANVDTMFLHSWWLALLAGNRVLVRLPSVRPPLVAHLLRLTAAVLAAPAFAGLRDDSLFIGYDHDDAITAGLSAACDVRMIWGGDDTVRTLRTAPLAVHGVDLAFPDRLSLAAFSAPAYAAADEAGRDRLAVALAADLAGFDQLACSSPRVVAWCGPGGDTAAADFRPRLAQALAAVTPSPPPGVVCAKLNAAAVAVMREQRGQVHQLGPGLTVVEGAAALDHCGGGLLLEWQLGSLDDLAARLDRRHQTLVHFGFSREDLTALARRLNGRALDRMVPAGRALAFAPVWDGLNLLAALTRLVDVEA